MSRATLTQILQDKYQALLARKRNLQTKNTELKYKAANFWEAKASDSWCAATASSEAKNAPALPSKEYHDGDVVSMQKDVNFEFFCKQLIAMGVNATAESARQELEELFTAVQRQEVQLSRKGGRVMAQYSLVRVYVLANIAGSEQCLIEHDRFDLRTGTQKTLMMPLEAKMREGEGWRDAAQRGLQTMVGLSPAWQDTYLVWDDSSLLCAQEKGSARDENTLDLLISVMVHEIHCRVERLDQRSSSKGQGQTQHNSANDAELEQIGLPNGQDVVFCEDSRTKVHVWCWKSREYERNGAHLKSFEKYLEDHGVDISQLGVGNNKSLFKFYHEVKEDKHCSLVEESGGRGSTGPKLVRVVRLLKIKLIAEVNKRKRVLIENEKYDANGHRRAAGQLIIRKLCDGEDWRAQVPIAISERIGLSVSLVNQCLSVDHESMLATEEERPSKGFVGIISRYQVNTVSVHVIDPLHEEMDRIGLPRGNDFVSKEFKSDDSSPSLHVWSWAPAVDEEAGTVRNFAGTALEALQHDLFDVEHVLTQAIADPQLSALGLEKPFQTSVQKLKQCAEGLSHIDKTLADVDVTGMIGKPDSPEEPGTSTPSAMTGLKSFIEANFVRAALPETKGNSAARRVSANCGAGMAQDLWNFDQAVTDTSALWKRIVERRDDWGFDYLEAMKECRDGVAMLEIYGEAMLEPFCVHSFGCEGAVAHSFVLAASSLYLDNPYHGPAHAAQVCHLSRWLTKSMGIAEKQSELESTAFMIAAFCHDIKHIGKNNAFCVQSEHPLALLYNNASVLERYHSSTCLELLETHRVLQKLPLSDRSLVRSHIIENILATDMADHFENISKFRVRREAQDFCVDLDADRRAVAKLCLKAGDLGHACLPWLMHVNWATRVLREFYGQGEEETRLGLAMSPLCDRKGVGNLGKSQQGFLNFVVAPLFQVMSETDTTVAYTEKKDESPKSPSHKTAKRVSSALGLSLSSSSLNIEIECIKHLQDNEKFWETDTDLVSNLIATLLAEGPPENPEQEESEPDTAPSSPTLSSPSHRAFKR
jgi:hypothetical protein